MNWVKCVRVLVITVPLVMLMLLFVMSKPLPRLVAYPLAPSNRTVLGILNGPRIQTEYTRMLNEQRFSFIDNGVMKNNTPFPKPSPNVTLSAGRMKTTYLSKVHNQPWIKTVILQTSPQTFSPIIPKPVVYTESRPLVRNKIFSFYLDSKSCESMEVKHNGSMLLPCKNISDYNVTRNKLTLNSIALHKFKLQFDRCVCVHEYLLWNIRQFSYANVYQCNLIIIFILLSWPTLV